MGWRLGLVKLSYTKIRKVIFFIKNPNVTKNNKKKILAAWRGGGVGVARVSDLFFFFQNNSSLKKSLILRG